MALSSFTVIIAFLCPTLSGDYLFIVVETAVSTGRSVRCHIQYSLSYVKEYNYVHVLLIIVIVTIFTENVNAL